MKTIYLDKISQEAKNYHNSGNYSCAESVFLTLAQNFEIPISDNLYGVASGFAGGALCGSLCGASSGAILAMGLLFGGDQFGKDKVNNKARLMSKEFNQSFIEAQGDPECRKILESFEMGSQAQHDKCIDISSSTATLAARLIAKELGYEIVKTHSN